MISHCLRPCRLQGVSHSDSLHGRFYPENGANTDLELKIELTAPGSTSLQRGSARRALIVILIQSYALCRTHKGLVQRKPESGIS